MTDRNLLSTLPLPTGKTALPDMTVHLDPDFAKHRAGREVMQALEDTFGEPGVEGPGVDIGQRLAMWPLKCATWSRAAYKAGEGSQPQSQAEAERQTVDYMLLYFTVCLLRQRVYLMGLDMSSVCLDDQALLGYLV